MKVPCVLFTFFQIVFCQLSWSYVKGPLDIFNNDTGVYGASQQFSDTYRPSSRDGAAAWTDSLGNLWLFGGYEGTGSLGDLWKFDTTTSNWGLIGGDPTARNTKANLNANIPATSWEPAFWTDSTGNFYMFGGDENGPINQLWQWSGQNWNFLSGTSSVNAQASYGKRGVASSTNLPGGRSAPAGWIDDNGAIWIFGGIGIDSEDDYGTLNDLWMYSGGVWVWMTGSSICGAVGSSTSPGSRQRMAYWKDNAGNLYIYGGEDDAGSVLNELWQYNINNNAWTLLNTLGPIVSSAKAISDTNNNIWLFGGNQKNQYLSDLWMWNNSTWTLVSGNRIANKPSVFNDTNPANIMPGGRTDTAFWLTENSLWIYGGYGYGTTETVGDLGDLWQFNFAKVPVPSQTDSSAGQMTQTLVYDNQVPTIGLLVVGATLGGVLLCSLVFAAGIDLVWRIKAARVDKFDELRNSKF